MKNFSFCCDHTVKGFGIVNKVEVDVFLELSCFFYDPTDVENLISSSSAFAESIFNIWKFMVHVLLKPGLENFEHFPGASDGKASAYNVGDLGSIPGSGRSPGEGNGNPLQYSCLENPWMEEHGRLQFMGLQRVKHD